MSAYTEGQTVKGKHPPQECPAGFYWRKTMGHDEFKLYPRKERKANQPHVGADGAVEIRLTVQRLSLIHI